jgi:hypothetical protein
MWALYQPQAGREVIHQLCSHCCLWDTTDSSIMQIVFLSFSYSSTFTITLSPNTGLRQERFQCKAMCSKNNSRFTQSVDTRSWKYYSTSEGTFGTCTCVNGQQKEMYNSTGDKMKACKCREKNYYWINLTVIVRCGKRHKNKIRNTYTKREAIFS